jgi:hypothetical protein
MEESLGYPQSEAFKSKVENLKRRIIYEETLEAARQVMEAWYEAIDSVDTDHRSEFR